MLKKLILSVAPVSASAPGFDPEATALDVIHSVTEGASIVHLHVRDEKCRLTDDLSVLKRAIEKIVAESDVIIQVSTGGVSEMTIEQRCAPLYYDKVEMASLNVGSVNLGDAVYQNPIKDVKYCVGQLVQQDILPEVEVFEIGMLHTAMELAKEFPIRKPALYNIVLGIPGAAPATIEALVAMRSFMPHDALWGFTHYGRVNFDLVMAAVFMGASVVRLGFEDSNSLNETSTAPTNAVLIGKLVHMLKTCGVTIATPQEAREILMLKAR